MNRNNTLTNPKTGEDFEVLPGMMSDAAPAWALEQIQMAQRILDRSKPMCPICSGIESGLIQADDPAAKERLVGKMRMHLEINNCGRVNKSRHSEEWIFEGGSDEHND